MTEVEFTKVMSTLTFCYKNFTVDEDVLEAWYLFFEDIQIDVFKKSVREHVKTSPYPPTINDLTKLCEQNTEKTKNETLISMFENGYFHQNGVSDTQAQRNYEKANMWVARQVEPTWLKNDMRVHYKNQLASANVKKLN